MQFGILLAFHAEALIFRQVPMEDVQLDGFHAVQIALQYRDRHEVASGINHQAAPGKSRLILNTDNRRPETVRRDVDQLQKCLQPAQHSQGIRRMQLRARRGYVQRVGLIFAKFLDRSALMLGGHQQRRFCWINCFSVRKHQGRLAMELFQEPLSRTLQPRFPVTRKSQAESLVHFQEAAARLQFGGRGHQIDSRGRLRAHRKCPKGQRQYGKENGNLTGKKTPHGADLQKIHPLRSRNPSVALRNT